MTSSTVFLFLGFLLGVLIGFALPGLLIALEDWHNEL